MTCSPENQSRIRASFASQSMMQSFGAELAEVKEGACTIVAPILDGNKQQHGFGHAALTFGLGDTAAGYAALSMMDLCDEVLTSEIKINLIAPAAGDKLEAEGKVIRAGKRLITVEAKVWAVTEGARTQIAAMLGTMVPVRKRESTAT